MTTLADTYVLDNGLATVSGGVIKLCVCQTEPLILSDCTELSGSGGKRVTTEQTITAEVTLTNGATANSRLLTVPSKTFTDGVSVGVDAGVADLWLAVYDGSRVLLKTDGITNQALVQGATLITPQFEYGLAQPQV